MTLIPPLIFVLVPAERIYLNCLYVLHYVNVEFQKKKVPVIASCQLCSIHRTASPTCSHLCLVHEVWKGLEPDTSTHFSPSQWKEVDGCQHQSPFAQSYWVVDQERNVFKVSTANSTQYVAPSNSSRCWRAIGPSKNEKHLKQARPATRR